MPRQRPSSSRPGPARAGLATLVACLAVAPAAPTHGAAAKGPRCDDISGITRVQNADWRVVALGVRTRAELFDSPELIACARGQRGPARVLALGGAFDDGREPLGLAGDRLLVQGDGSSTSAGDGGNVMVVDLRARRSLDLGLASWSVTPEFTARPTAITAGGGIATATWSGTYVPTDPTAGALQLWNGAAFAPGAAQVQTLTAAVQGLDGRGGVYARVGNDVSLVVPAAVPTSAFTSKVQFRRGKLKGRVAGAKLTRTTLAVEQRAFTPVASTPWQLVVDRRGRGAARAHLEARPLAGDAFAAQRIDLARGAEKDLKVLAVHSEAVVVAGRFADGGGAREIRILWAPGSGYPVIRIPATPTAERSGQVAVGSGAVAIADDVDLRIWRGGAEPTVVQAPGVRDLAMEAQGSTHEPRFRGEVNLLLREATGRIVALLIAPKLPN